MSSSSEENESKSMKFSSKGKKKQRKLSPLSKKPIKSILKKERTMSEENDSDSGVQENPEEVAKEGVDASENNSAIKQEISHMSFEELQELKERLGLKMYNQALYGNKSKSKSKSAGTFKRANKNRPLEMSSKRPVRLDVTQSKQPVRRDPRFDDLSGEYDERLFKQSYGFLDKVKERDRQKLAKKLPEVKDDSEKEKIKKVLTKMTQQAKTAEDKEKRAQTNQKLKKKEREAVLEGKTPFYLKKSERKKLELAEKFKELKKSGKLEKYLAKKRKKNASKERKNLPFTS